jgi:Xaa-Pro dipeptidase
MTQPSGTSLEQRLCMRSGSASLQIRTGWMRLMTNEDPRLPFTDAEYVERVTRLRARMAERDIELLLVTAPESQYYVTGFRTGSMHGFLVLALPLEGEALWVVRKTELSNVHTLAAISWVKQGVGVADGMDPVEVLSCAIADMGYSGARLGVDRQSLFFHAAYQMALGEQLPKATLLDASGLIEPLRAVKSKAELDYMHQAGTITTSSLRAGIEAVADGVTDTEVGAVITASAIRAGSEKMTGGPFVTVGVRTFLAHSSWIGQPIRTGDIVNTEMACVAAQYNVPCFRVSVIGEPSNELRALHAASEAGLAAAMEGIEPGMTSHDADALVRRVVAATGMGEYFVVRAAYGIGLAFGPGWGEDNVMSIRPHDLRVLTPGMCFHVVPALYKQGFGAVCCSMPVVLGENALEPLTDLEPRLFVR